MRSLHGGRGAKDLDEWFQGQSAEYWHLKTSDGFEDSKRVTLIDDILKIKTLGEREADPPQTVRWDRVLSQEFVLRRAMSLTQ